MKIYNLHAKAALGKIDFETKTLPDKIGLVTTIQYLPEMKKVSDYLWKKGIKAALGGQVLGCDVSSVERIKDDISAFLYIGSGEFHPIGVALKTGKPVYSLHPESMKIRKIEESEIDKIRRKQKGMLAKFHNSNVIGVIITTKKGQSEVQGGIKKIKEIEKRYPEKRFYHFLCDTLDFGSLENFPFIQVWVNTMCPRIMEDINILNIQDL